MLGQTVLKIEALACMHIAHHVAEGAYTLFAVIWIRTSVLIMTMMQKKVISNCIVIMMSVTVIMMSVIVVIMISVNAVVLVCVIVLTTTSMTLVVLWLQVAAYEQAKQLVWQRKAAIEQLASELTSDPLETVQGKRIVEVIETTAVGDPELLPSNGVWSDAQVLVEVPDVSMHGCHQAA